MSYEKMSYQERLDHIESVIRKTEDKQKLKEFINSVKVMNLKVNDKDRLLDELNYKITGRKFTDKQIMDNILEQMPDISDIN